MDKSQTKKCLNIVVVGRSGVGKSSFLNYVAGKQVFKTANSGPVTQSYFKSIDIELPEKNITYSLFDTKGLEAGNTDEWKVAIFHEIDRRDKSENIYDWLHTVLYCIDASAKRIQDYEIRCIKELMKHSSVVVLLTKKDRVTAGELKDLTQTILMELGNKIQIKAVCSGEYRNRKGQISKPEGLGQVLRVSFLGMWEKVAKVYPSRLLRGIDTVFADLELPCTNDGFFALVTLVKGLDASDFIHQWKSQKYIGQRKVIPSEFEYFCSDKSNIKFYEGRTKHRFKFQYKTQASKSLKLPTSIIVDDDLIGCSLRGYIRCIVVIFKLLINNIQACNLDKRIDPFKKHNIIHELLTFYNQVNEDNKSILMFNDTLEAIHKIKNYDFSSLDKELNIRANAIDNKLQDFKKCLFFSTEERNKVILAYLEFRDFIALKISELWILLNKFKDKYKAELNAYGQYCIREDDAISQPNQNVEVLKHMMMVLKDDVITEREHKLLSKFAFEYKISDDEYHTVYRQILNNNAYEK